VKQLQRVDVVINLDNGSLKSQSIIDNTFKVIGRDILAEKCLGYLK